MRSAGAFLDDDPTLAPRHAQRRKLPGSARSGGELPPHAPIIARAACVISRGGQGITQKALGAGVPVCAVPFCRDQFDVDRRVEHADAELDSGAVGVSA